MRLDPDVYRVAYEVLFDGEGWHDLPTSLLHGLWRRGIPVVEHHRYTNALYACYSARIFDASIADQLNALALIACMVENP